MAEFKPNEAQKRAIDIRGRNILVSAAAGSGKTTVLVERVLKMIMEDLIDIDSLIIMTFTKAAAASMKEKIYSRIRKALKEEELEEKVKDHLKRQLMKIHGARICTIDSLCMDIVKENFQCVDIDPGFSIADEAEIAMMKSDILGEILENHYSDPTPEFLNFAGYYTDKDDSKIEELILELLRFAESHPSPDHWLSMLVGSYENVLNLTPDPEKEENKWITVFAQIVNSKLEAIQDLCLDGIIACGENYGPENYLTNFEYVNNQLEKIAGNCFDNRGSLLEETLENWPSLKPISKKAGVDEALKEKAKTAYSSIKKELESLYNRFFYQGLEGMYKDMGGCEGIVRELVQLTFELRKKLLAGKKERNVFGFNDIAHFALDVLIGYDEEGNMFFTETADSIAKATNQIIVDEYQDTNRLQDALVTALSAERFGRPDVFMVGDMKQSIYGFRMACPELFIEKYNSYELYDNSERIILGENYRSRKEVVDFTNLIFSQTMIPAVGGIDYSDGNELKYGADYEAPLFDMTPEILMIQGSGENAKLAEGYTIARKIEELVQSGVVRYSDIAILTRTANNPQLERCLSDRNIPMVKSANKGFFDTLEVRLALNLLRIIDNPLQDIPFAAVLTSPVVGVDANGLARIKTGYTEKDFSMYKGCLKMAESDENLAQFMEKLEIWRQRSDYFGVAYFIEYVLEDSGLYNIISAMPQGDGRKANLEFLKSLATDFAKGTYTGLFNFIRYIEEIRKADIDFGQAQVVNADLDAVQLMTIHKSKGLEFPVVFLAAAGKQYNDKDTSRPIVLDADLGVGIELRDVEEKTKKRTLLMETIIEKKKRDLYAEEMRLLYVALTRAKEKLFVSGTEGRMQTQITKWDMDKACENPVQPLSEAAVLSAKSFMTLIGNCLTQKTDVPFQWDIKALEDIETDRVVELFNLAEKKEAIQELIRQAEESPEDLFSYVYPYEEATRTQVKMTASQLEKKEEYDGSEDKAFDAEREIEIEEEKVFKAEKTGLSKAAERGTVYHKVFELWDYENTDVESQLEKLTAQGMITAEQKKLIQPAHFEHFQKTDLGGRMKKAYENQSLYREQQFVMGIEEKGELRLIQGIIDAFFEEDGNIILVDYKTDRNTDEDHYRTVYMPQQEAYAKALEAAKGKPVTEIILYSTELGREIRLK